MDSLCDKRGVIEVSNSNALVHAAVNRMGSSFVITRVCS